ncbi:MAG: threonine/serine exporter family protein [Oscillospiraceae bacterium]|nr:threonine/serine exporter family protein [Oscillospiraceae bacterium]
MMEYIIQTLMGAIGSVGFAVLFNVRGKRLVLFFLGGALDWAVYLLCYHNGCTGFVSMFFATMTAALTSEVLARIIHTPVLLLLVPMLVPLIPGGDLYRSMDALIRSEKEYFLAYGSSAITAAGAICLGIICITALTHIIFSIGDHFRKANH